MKQLILATVLASTAGVALAQVPPAPPAAPPHGARMDADRDGTVSRAEMQAAADRRFARLDANRDGRVTAEEFRARALTRFERRDVNRDGKLDRSERGPRHRAPRPAA